MEQVELLTRPALEQIVSEIQVSVAQDAQTATTKASEAASSATTATQKASEAAASATTATQKASEAAASATTATQKASDATNSAATATQKATEAASSATTATQKATDATNSAATATQKATEAASSATTATQKATEAATSATNSSNSATASGNSATAAALSAAAALAAATNYVVVNNSVSTSYTIDMAAHDNQFHISTFTGNVGTVNILNLAAGRSVLWVIINGGAGGYTPTLPVSVKLPGGAAVDYNTAVGGITMISLTAISSSVIVASYVKY